MERYLEGEELDRGRRARAQGRGHARRALPGRVRRRDEEPRHDGAARPARRGRALAGEEGDDDRVRRREAGGVRLQDGRRPVRRAHQRSSASSPAPLTGDTTLVDPRTHAKERLGQILLLQGKEHEPVDEFGVGDLGAVAKLKDVVTGDVLVDHEVPVEPPHIDFPEPVMSFAVTPKAKGDEEKMATGAAPARRGGSDAAPAARPADRRGAPLRDEPDARRGRGRAR